MQVKLYSSHSALYAMRKNNLTGTVQFFASDQNMVALTKMMTGLEVHPGTFHPLVFHTVDEDENRILALVTGFENSPFDESLAEAGLSHLQGSLLLRSGDRDIQFGLHRLGLLPQINTEIEDIPTFYDSVDAALSVFRTPTNLGGLIGDSTNPPFQLEGKPGENPDIEVTIDAMYFLAAMDMHREGMAVQYICREDQTVKSLDLTDDYFPSMSYEVGDLVGPPLVTASVLDRARHYHQHGAPGEYHWLRDTVSLDYLAVYGLRPDKKYTARMITPMFPGTLFGDRVEIMVTDKGDIGREIRVTLPTTETYTIEDYHFNDWTHAYMIVDGDGAEELRDKGFPSRDYLSLHNSM